MNKQLQITNKKNVCEQPNSFQSETGSITIVVALMLPAMLFIIGLIVNAAQVGFNQQRLDNTCDTISMSSAAAQAAGMNEEGDLNAERMKEFKKCRKYLSHNIWYSFWEGNKVIRYFKKCITNLRKYQDDANIYYAQEALKTAEHVKNINQPEGIEWELKPDNMGEKLVEYEECKKKPVFFVSAEKLRVFDPSFIVASTWSNSRAGSTYVTGPHNGISYRIKKYDTFVPGMGFIREKVKKTDKPVEAAFTLVQKPKDYIMFPSIFGKMPELKSYSKAKPAGGNIEEGKATYMPVLINNRKEDK